MVFDEIGKTEIMWYEGKHNFLWGIQLYCVCFCARNNHSPEFTQTVEIACKYRLSSRGGEEGKAEGLENLRVEDLKLLARVYDADDAHTIKEKDVL